MLVTVLNESTYSVVSFDMVHHGFSEYHGVQVVHPSGKESRKIKTCDEIRSRETR